MAKTLVISIDALITADLERLQQLPNLSRIMKDASVVKDIVETLKFRHFTLGAIAIFMYITVETGIPNQANLYM